MMEKDWYDKFMDSKSDLWKRIYETNDETYEHPNGWMCTIDHAENHVKSAVAAERRLVWDAFDKTFAERISDGDEALSAALDKIFPDGEPQP